MLWHFDSSRSGSWPNASDNKLHKLECGLRCWKNECHGQTDTVQGDRSHTESNKAYHYNHAVLIEGRINWTIVHVLHYTHSVAWQVSHMHYYVYTIYNAAIIPNCCKTVELTVLHTQSEPRIDHEFKRRTCKETAQRPVKPHVCIYAHTHTRKNRMETNNRRIYTSKTVWHMNHVQKYV